MIQLKNIGLLTILIGILSACTEIIPMEFATDFERLVVDATILNTDTVQYVKLSKINLDDENTIVSPVEGAIVKINDGSRDYDFFESKSSRGLYFCKDRLVGEFEKNYVLSISQAGVKGYDGVDNYTASAIMSRPLQFDSVTYTYVNVPHKHKLGVYLNCWAEESSEVNFYLFKAWKNSVLLTDTLYEYVQIEDEVFNGNYINGIGCQFLSDRKADEYVNNGDTLTLEIDNIDRAYFEYLISAQKEDRGVNPLFGGPPANVTTNISNGAVGIFRVYSVVKQSVIVDGIGRDESL